MDLSGALGQVVALLQLLQLLVRRGLQRHAHRRLHRARRRAASLQGMRRQVGVGRGQAAARAQAAFKERGDSLAEADLAHAARAVEVFRAQLEAFAAAHGDAIRKDAAFRARFGGMCAKMGIDPLASSKGAWAAVVGSFYFELGVQIVTLAIATRELNGGLLNLDELLTKLKRVRARTAATKSVDVSVDDVLTAVERLSVLGGGLRVAEMGARRVLVSVPLELSTDSTTVLDFAAKHNAKASVAALRKELKWDEERAKRALTDVASEGMAWFDKPAEEYWFVVFIPGGLAV